MTCLLKGPKQKLDKYTELNKSLPLHAHSQDFTL